MPSPVAFGIDAWHGRSGPTSAFRSARSRKQSVWDESQREEAAFSPSDPHCEEPARQRHTDARLDLAETYDCAAHRKVEEEEEGERAQGTGETGRGGAEAEGGGSEREESEVRCETSVQDGGDAGPTPILGRLTSAPARAALLKPLARGQRAVELRRQGFVTSRRDGTAA